MALTPLRILCIYLLHFAICNEVDNDIEGRLNFLSDRMGFCVSYFQYLRTDDFVIGKLKLPNLKLGDTVSMTFYGAYPAEIGYDTRFHGSLFPDESSAEVLNKIQQGQPITYRIDFPIAPRIPELQNIFINGEELCATIFIERGKKFVYEHTLENVNGTIPVFKYNMNIPFFSQVTACGIAETGMVNVGITPHTYNATTLHRGEHPWLTAVYSTQAPKRYFICSGALITTEIVLTTAHCLQGLNAEDIEIMLGVYNLSSAAEDHTTIRQIAYKIIHPEYKRKQNFSDSDLALLQMKSPVSFTEFIKPICLWSLASDVPLIVGHTAVVVGWQSGSDVALPKKLKTNIISERKCLHSLAAHTDVSKSTKLLCAEKSKYLGSCIPSASENLMIYQNGIWMLRGITATSSGHEQHCNLQPYMVFCDVAKHKSWLEHHMVKNDASKSVAPEDICGRTDDVQGSEQPWLAAIYRKSTTGLVFFCTGALISTRNVLVPANCLNKPQKEIIHADFIRVYLGRYDLNSPAESNAVARDVAFMIRHPKYEDTLGLFYDNDVAILHLKSSVSFSQFIRPICLWSESTVESEIVGQSVTLASWNRLGILDESLTVPHSAEVSVASMEYCQTTGFNVSTTTHFLCTPRFGNNLDGILAIKRKGQWQLRGLSTSNTAYQPKYNSIRYRLYSDIEEYTDWIQTNLM